MELNHQAAALVENLVRSPERFGLQVHDVPGGGRLIDLGIESRGGLAAGVELARICLGGLADVRLTPAREHLGATVDVVVYTDHPVAACLASQYAGWQIHEGDFFALGSGPIRAAGSREPLFDTIGYRERPTEVVGVVETSTLPAPDVFTYLAEACQVPQSQVTLLAAAVTSAAGAVQVVARALETALHKLHELDFDVSRVVSGFGVAPLPPVGGKTLAAMGRTNDSVLYGGEVTLWLTGDDESLNEVGPKIPSSTSKDFGQPFADLFDRYDRNFYKIDPLLFSPAGVTLVNVDTGHRKRYGHPAPDLLNRSFGS